MDYTQGVSHVQCLIVLDKLTHGVYSSVHSKRTGKQGKQTCLQKYRLKVSELLGA